MCNQIKISSIQVIMFVFYFQNDMLMSLSTQKATVNEDDLKKLEEFTSDFGQEGQRYVISVYILMFHDICDFIQLEPSLNSAADYVGYSVNLYK